MFKIESYVTPILLSYVDKYVKDFKPADAQVSLWGGGVVLHNLVLKTDVLQQEVALPFTLISGRIHELLIQVPWTKIMSEPIIVNIDTIECILSIRPPSTEDEKQVAEQPRTQVVEAPPGYMQALVRRIVSNIAVRIHHLIVKYVQDDIILSLNVKHLSVDSCGANWQPAFADIDQVHPAIRRLVVLDDLTLCLDSADSDGRIRFYQDPLLYRCRLEFRVLIQLVSANTRRASSISIQLRSNKLAWGVTSEQMLLLIRLLKESGSKKVKTPTPTQTKLKMKESTLSLHNTSSNQAEPHRKESWSEWAWSWMPSIVDREGGIEEAPMPVNPLPIVFTAYLDDVSLSIKIMELEANNRKRSRSILEIHAVHVGIKSNVCTPTALRVKLGIRALNVKSFGKCTCGHMDYNASYDETTYYLANRVPHTEDWQWPEDNLESPKQVEVAEADEETDQSPELSKNVLGTSDGKLADTQSQPGPAPQRISLVKERASQFRSLLDLEGQSNKRGQDDGDELWASMESLIYLEYIHERSPPKVYTNPYDNPPTDFEYSDWDEENFLNIQVKPIELRLCMGLIHRLKSIQNIFNNVPETKSGPTMRVLTVEECEALMNNLPQRRINVDITDLRLRIHPWDHSPSERPSVTPLVLDVELPKGTFIVTLPLYPNRVCSAAGQMPDDTGPLWRGARVHVTAALNSIQASLCSITDEQPKPCVRTDMRFVVHVLLHPEYFVKKRSVLYSYAFKIRESNVSGSAARLYAATQVLWSLMKQKMSLPLAQTTLAKDALNDEEFVALDVTMEDFSVRGYLTQNIMTHIVQLQSIRATVIQSPSPGSGEMKQAWLFSGPDAPINRAFIRLAVQWCTKPFKGSMDYLGIWSEPVAISIDPMFVKWLSYKPLTKPSSDMGSSVPLNRTVSATIFLNRRRAHASSSGRGVSKSTSQAEQVHVRARSGSSSEPSENKDRPSLSPSMQAAKSLYWWKGDGLLHLHERLKKVFVTLELGLVLVYVTTKTASAVDCATVRLAMEKHAVNKQGVMVLSIGRWSMYTSTITKNLWHQIDHEGPTYMTARELEDLEHQESFPWRMILADMSCYALEANVKKTTSGKTGSLKVTDLANPRTVVELVTTTVILSVAQKCLQHKIVIKKAEAQHTHRREEMSKEEAKLRYFTSGSDFKPTSLGEFLRGPLKRQQETEDQKTPETTTPEVVIAPIHKVADGPTVSLGFNLHADTPPIIVRIEHDQVHLVSATIHCLSHFITLLRQDPMARVKQTPSSVPLVPSPPKPTTVRSLSDLEETSMSDTTKSETQSDLMTIFQAHPDFDDQIKTFLWFQWVVSRATIVISTDQVKLAFDMDDMITTIDLQEHYNQMKIKVASAFIKQYERTESGQWATGLLGGRVLEALEPADPKEATYFLSVTVTQARISTLPASWKAELHPKLLDQNMGSDSMWEIYAILAPLEIVILPTIMDNIMSVANAMAPRSYCQPAPDECHRPSFDLPFVYLSAGGVRFILNCDIANENIDDTFSVTIGKIALNPHPDNPICRRPIIGKESAWNAAASHLEGRQYEIFIKDISVRTARLSQLVSEQESVADAQKGVTGENPAVKWGQAVVTPVLTPILHPLDVNVILAPALFVGGVMTCGSAFELNMVSDCSIEINLDQLNLALCMQKSLQRSFTKRILTGFADEGVCPYSDILINRRRLAGDSSLCGTPKQAEDLSLKSEVEIAVTQGMDSGVDTASRSTLKSSHLMETPLKKTYSVTFVEQAFDASDHIEVFMTIGVIELSLYTADDGSSEMNILKPDIMPHISLVKQSQIEELRRPKQGSRSLTETIRTTDFGMTQLNLSDTAMVRKNPGNIPLLHVQLQQPNFYYWKRRSQKSFQASLFNIWIGFGLGIVENFWHAPLLSTSKGIPDPESDIPPALATVKYTTSTVGTSLLNTSTTNSKVNLQLDVERPILIEISENSLRRLVGIEKLLKAKLSHKKINPTTETPYPSLPILYRIRRFMGQYSVDVATVNISQLAVSGFGLTAGWDSTSLQLSWNSRPDRLVFRGLVNSLLISAGPHNEPRQPVLHPLQLGLYMEAVWESWRRAEGGYIAKEPTTRLNIDVDRVVFDVRPENLSDLLEIPKTVKNILKTPKVTDVTQTSSAETVFSELSESIAQSSSTIGSQSVTSEIVIEAGHHYYKDDLRSGAFKIVSGGQLPMAYQVTLHRDIVSWRYPHPRAITRLIAFPLPNQNEEIDCILQFYNRTLLEWEPHSYITLPVNEPKEYIIHGHPPESVFSTTWRFRILSKNQTKSAYVFNMAKFQTTSDPLVADPEPEEENKDELTITAEQLSGVLRVDSYFAPHLTPRTSISLRFVRIQVNAHNSLPVFNRAEPSLEGYYVSKPLMRTHRVLAITAEETAVHSALNTPSGLCFLLETLLSSDIVDCTTGTMERMVNSFRVQAGLSVRGSPLNFEQSRTRLCTSNIHVALHIPRLRTLLSLAEDWKDATKECSRKYVSKDNEITKSKREVADEIASLLEGRVSLWIHNSCAVPVRIGQDNTEEIIVLASGARLAYRWRHPSVVKRIRFALAKPEVDWCWSSSVPFVQGEYRVRLGDTDPSSNRGPNSGEYMFITVNNVGAHRTMRISGRLLLANMLRLNVQYKVREYREEKNQWQTALSGELPGETIARTIISCANSELVLKIKFVNHETGWSGDIPLKECPKENVPWLVKVPSDGDVPYISVWCRVVRARSDGRIFAMIWPLYVLRSDLTLDTDVLVSTDTGIPTPVDSATEDTRPAPIIQSAPGRGTCTHLLAPGTTSARHSLSFQYRNIECPVTREAVPLHYGVTDSSVFDKRTPVASIDELLKDINAWLDRSGRLATSAWPYSIVVKHWSGTWMPALMQPRCEVNVHYQAVKAGGGCSLEVRVSPVVVFCNASPVSLTLRAHDAAPLCKLDTGKAISPPSIVLRKPFFVSIEIERETFVSNQLEVYSKEPGRYGTPPSGQVAIDYPLTFIIQCHQEVTLLNLHYEIKEDINVLGITSAFVLFNKLNMDILASSDVVPNEMDHDVVIHPKSFKLIQPTKPGSIEGTPLCRFWLGNRWCGGEVSELHIFLSLALPDGAEPAHPPVPLRLGLATQRKSISLVNTKNESIPVVVIQTKHEGRWVVTVARDPCPQFVVYNLTAATIAIAQPKPDVEDGRIEVVPDCLGAQWFLSLPSEAVRHYSKPSYSIRHPLPPEVPVLVPFLTFAKIHEDDPYPVWCPSVAVAEGEQLVQLTHKTTVKLRVRTFPHSTLIELRDIDYKDISASDIRRRLVEHLPPVEGISSSSLLQQKVRTPNIKRIEGDEELLEHYPMSSLLSEKEIQDAKRAEFMKDLDQSIIELKQSQTSHVKPTVAIKTSDSNIGNRSPMLKQSESFQKRFEEAQALMYEKIHGSERPKLDDEDKVSIHMILQCPSSTMDMAKTSVTPLEQILGVETQSAKSEVVSVVPPDAGEKAAENSIIEEVSEVAGPSNVPLSGVEGVVSSVTIAKPASVPSELSAALMQEQSSGFEQSIRLESERLRCVVAGVVVEMAAASDTNPLLALHIDRAALLLSTFYKKIKTLLSVADIQIDNLQYENGQFDFPVIATTRAQPLEPDRWTTLWSIFTDNAVFATRHETARFFLKTCHDSWTMMNYDFSELTEVDLRAGPLALYIEDAYVTALADLFRSAAPPSRPSDDAAILTEARAIRSPLRLRMLYIHPLDITLTLHTAVRMYIALDQSPLHLSAFRLQYMFTSTERLAHALTVHYLSAAILGAGWVVGGLELLGAPGALAARLGGATGGVKGIASAAAAALLRSLSAWAGSLARNLDLLAGDEEHARRAAAARRRPPDSFVAGLLAGITNFAINILGAVGGLAHHPLVGVAVGETESSAAALRRGLLGALTKPLSATADLVAYAGQGLLKQTGWDPVPQPRSLMQSEEPPSGWTRECVRWTFRLADFTTIGGYEVQLNEMPFLLLLTHKFIVLADQVTEGIVETIDMQYCNLGPFDGSTIVLYVKPQRPKRKLSARTVEKTQNEDDEYKVSAVAMARVARYTGAEAGAGAGAGAGEVRLLSIEAAAGQAHALYAGLCAVIHHNSDTHFPLL